MQSLVGEYYATRSGGLDEQTVVKSSKRRTKETAVPRALLSTLAPALGLSEWITEQGENERGLAGNTSSTE